jgi:outer membrane protein assembly factor BamB/tetratricopeptide (TPR) repeat protein
MTLKGNLEVLNLSDIFQSLSLNQHTGTLRVTDGKREKLIYFAQGEITLLSSDKKVKIGDMLVETGKISHEDLDYALAQQKKTRKRLGEILIEEGFVTEEDVAEVVRSQIEEEIYDLFLWKKADFEFLIDYCPEKLKNPAHQVTKLQFNTNSLIMEALRRLDEWELISKEIPTLKEVYKVTSASPALDDIDLPERVKAEIRLIDGEKTVEAIAEETNLSEFELCKLLYELKTRKIIAPLSPPELSERADDCFEKGKFRQASALYERLAEVLPKNVSIRWHLADSLRAFGDEPRALEQYELIAKRLEATRERAELARVYGAILDLSPGRRDVAEKLRALGRARWKQKAARAVLYSVFAAVAAGALIFGGIRSDGVSHVLEWFRRSTGIGAGELADASRNELAAKELEGRADALLRQGKVKDAFDALSKILTTYPKTGVAALVVLPMRIETIPPGKEVWINGIFRDRTPNVFRYAPGHEDAKAPLHVEVRDQGHVLWQGDLDPTQFNDLRIDLFRRPKWSIATGGAVRSRPVFTGAGKDAAMYFTSLDGYLHGVRLEDRVPLAKIPLRDNVDPFGEAVSDPALARDQIVIGTLDGRVVVYDLQSRSKAFDVRVSDEALLARPAIIEDGQTAAVGGVDGEVALISLGRRTMLTKSAVLCSNSVTSLESAGPQLLVGSRDNWLRAYDVNDHRVSGIELRGDIVAAPAFNDRSVLAGDRTGRVVCADRATLTEVWSAEEGSAVSGIAVVDDLTIVACANGAIQAHDGATGRVLWKTIVEQGAGRPVVHGGDVFVATAPPSPPRVANTPAEPTPGYVHVLDVRSGAERWTGQLPAAVRGEPVWFESQLFLGCEDGNVYCFEAP